MSLFHADTAGSKASGYCCWLIGEEDPVLDVVAFGDPPESRGAVEASVDLLRPIAAQRSRDRAHVRTTIGAQQLVHIGILRPRWADLRQPSSYGVSKGYEPFPGTGWVVC